MYNETYAYNGSLNCTSPVIDLYMSLVPVTFSTGLSELQCQHLKFKSTTLFLIPLHTIYFIIVLFIFLIMMLLTVGPVW
jgi:hypothetical protein